MNKKKSEIVEEARLTASNLIQEYFYLQGAILWGSILQADDEEPISSDVDMLVLVSDLNHYYLKFKSQMFGIPVTKIIRKNISFDLFFVDRSYLETAIRNSHWTVINAFIKGIRVIDHPDFDRLRELAKEFQPFSLNSTSDWFNQAQALLEKSRKLLAEDQYENSIILARDATQSAIYAYIYETLGRPPSPKTLLSDLKNSRGTEDLITFFLSIHGLLDISKEDALEVQLQGYNLMRRIASTIR